MMLNDYLVSMNPVSLSLIWSMWVVMKWVPISIILPIKKSDWSLKKTTHLKNDLDLSGRSWSFNQVWVFHLVFINKTYTILCQWKINKKNRNCASFGIWIYTALVGIDPIVAPIGHAWSRGAAHASVEGLSNRHSRPTVRWRRPRGCVKNPYFTAARGDA